MAKARSVRNMLSRALNAAGIPSRSVRKESRPYGCVLTMADGSPISDAVVQVVRAMPRRKLVVRRGEYLVS